MIKTVNAAAQALGVQLPIFLHGYDYPFPDGRGVDFLGLVEPWFGDSFNQKGHPRDSDAQLLTRKQILAGFVDAMNRMLAGLEAKYAGTVYYVDFRNTLPNHLDWANVLHPVKDGFHEAFRQAEFQASPSAGVGESSGPATRSRQR